MFANSQSDIRGQNQSVGFSMRSCEARLQTDIATVGNTIMDGPQSMTVSRKLDSNSAVDVALESATDRILRVTRHALLMLFFVAFMDLLSERSPGGH